MRSNTQQRHSPPTRALSMIQAAPFACSTAGSKVKESNSTYYSDEIIVGRYICAKGVVHVRTTSFMLVIYMKWTFKQVFRNTNKKNKKAVYFF